MRGLLNGALLPHQAAVATDAIARVLYRRLISHKLMLEWETARVAGQSSAQRENQFLWRLLGGIAFSGVTTLGVQVMNPTRLFICRAVFDFVVVFAAACQMAARRLSAKTNAAGAGRQNYLRQIARQTWRYFDDFVGPQTNWLAPDNYQERLRVEIAQRTSPTNIGMWLLAVPTAHDFGYISGDDAIGRLLPTLRNLDNLERFRGHFLNWYEIQREEALRPRYVSVVDSGNLLGCLLTLIESINDLTAAPVLDETAQHGLSDTLELLCHALKSETDKAAQVVRWKAI